jgi:hypothetical protein
MFPRRLKVTRAFNWKHHREGWGRVEALVCDHLTCEDGTLFVSAVEDQFLYHGALREPWVGVIHQVPHHDLPGFPDIARLLALKTFRESLPFCRGLWTLTDYVRRFLVAQDVPVPVGVLPYVSARDVPPFEWERFAARKRPRLLHVGEYLRRYQSFVDLDLPGWDKQLLRPSEWERLSASLQLNDSVEVIPAVTNEAYDTLLTESVVFLDLEDAPANTAVVECIARATPICVNRVGGIAEYLGQDYPLYHRGDAADILADAGRVRAGHEYLLSWRERATTDKDFLRRATENAVYMTLPTPPSQQSSFPQFDLSVLIAVYGRPESLREQLDRFCEQVGAPRFEVILWNNSPTNSILVDDLAEAFSDRLALRVFHSRDNIYCGMRQAVPALARSEVLLISDDDVRPQPEYVRVMWDAHRRHGPDAAVCLRGHVFKPHRFDVDDPGKMWREEIQVTFHDEGAPDCVVDFAHADTLIMSMDLMRRAARIPMTHPEYVLVDDYWLSYVLSAKLGATCQKIQAPHAFSFTASANDPDVALYHNPRVREQRARFYAEHMLAGWPPHAQIKKPEDG